SEKNVVVAQGAEPDVDVVADRGEGSLADGVASSDAKSVVEKIRVTRDHDFRQVERTHDRCERQPNETPGLDQTRAVGCRGLAAYEATMFEKSAADFGLETSGPAARARGAGVGNLDVAD